MLSKILKDIQETLEMDVFLSIFQAVIFHNENDCFIIHYCTQKSSELSF